MKPVFFIAALGIASALMSRWKIMQEEKAFYSGLSLAFGICAAVLLIFKRND